MPSKLNYLFLNQTTNKHLISHLINFQFYDFSLAQSKMNTNSNKKNQSFPEASSPPKVGTENWGTHIMGTPAVPSSIIIPTCNIAPLTNQATVPWSQSSTCSIHGAKKLKPPHTTSGTTVSLPSYYSINFFLINPNLKLGTINRR